MSVKTTGFDPLKLLVLFFMINIFATKINGLNPRNLQDNTPPGAPDTGVKCTTCCNTCTQSPPPPPPPSPPPPSPPHSPKKPPSPYCPPPPPSPSFIYINGPPGNVYPVDPYFSGAGRVSVVGLLLLVGCGLFGLLAFW